MKWAHIGEIVSFCPEVLSPNMIWLNLIWMIYTKGYWNNSISVIVKIKQLLHMKLKSNILDFVKKLQNFDT
jgi:hypothetical protein